MPAREVVRAASFRRRVGHRVDEARLKGFLARMGFSPVSTVAEPGDYAIRGGIVDIWPAGQSGRAGAAGFLRRQLDGARRFDPVSQRTVEKLTRSNSPRCPRWCWTRPRSPGSGRTTASNSAPPARTIRLYEAVSAGRKHQGMEHWLPFFHDRLETLFDYLPEAAVMLDDQVTPMRLARWEAVDDAYDARAEAMAAEGRIDTVYKPVAPGLLYLDDAAWEAALAGHG
jgi:transcription-repair coupling factor (superfamily II helicase)